MSSARGGETACLLLAFSILDYFVLADGVTSPSYDVHISGEVCELVPLPGYFVDGYLYPGISSTGIPMLG